MIAGVGLPYAYDHFDENDADRPDGPPFICFLYPGRDDFMADDANYSRITELVIELYTDNADFTLEESVEAALTAAGLPFGKSGPTHIESERMFQTTYTTEVLLTNAE